MRQFVVVIISYQVTRAAMAKRAKCAALEQSGGVFFTLGVYFHAVSFLSKNNCFLMGLYFPKQVFNGSCSKNLKTIDLSDTFGI